MIMTLERSLSHPAHSRVQKLIARARRRQLELAREGHVTESALHAERARRLFGLIAAC